MSAEIQTEVKVADHYKELKLVVTVGVVASIAAGYALKEIKEKELFHLDGYEAWGDFIQGEYGWARRYADQLIVDADTINSLPSSLRKLITSHSAARELAKLPEPLRVIVLDEVKKTTGKKSVSATDIKKHSPPPARPAAKGRPPERPAAKPEAPKIKDGTGMEVPVESLELWNRKSEAQGLVSYTKSVLLQAKTARDAKDLLYVEVDFTDNIAKLEQVIKDLERAVPYAVCATCQGKNPAGCLSCKGRGLVSKFLWDNVVPVEVKELRKK